MVVCLKRFLGISPPGKIENPCNKCVSKKRERRVILVTTNFYGCMWLIVYFVPPILSWLINDPILSINPVGRLGKGNQLVTFYLRNHLNLSLPV